MSPRSLAVLKPSSGSPAPAGLAHRPGEVADALAGRARRCRRRGSPGRCARAPPSPAPPPPAARRARPGRRGNGLGGFGVGHGAHRRAGDPGEGSRWVSRRRPARISRCSSRRWTCHWGSRGASQFITHALVRWASQVVHRRGEEWKPALAPPTVRLTSAGMSAVDRIGTRRRKFVPQVWCAPSRRPGLAAARACRGSPARPGSRPVRASASGSSAARCRSRCRTGA